ncbi:single-stranded DNA-binding protein [Desulfonatronum parangueonense]
MSGSLNKAIIIGRLGTTPELKYTAQGTPVTSFNMATDESYTDKTGNKVEQTEWHRIVVWQRQAENVCKFLQKGSLALVEGRLQTRKWQDQQGQDRYTTEIVAQNVTFMDSKQDSERLREGQGGDDQQVYPKQRQQGSEMPPDDGPPF